MPRLTPLIAIGLLILLILGAGFVWWPKCEEFRWLKSQLEIKEKAIIQKEEYFSKLNTLSKELEGYQEEIAKIESALPDEVSEADFFNFIQKTSSENGLIFKEIYSVKISSSKKDGKEISEVSFSISLFGSYLAFKNFLSVIYQSSRLIEVDSIKFSSPPEKKDLFDFDLTLVAHYLPR